MTPDFEVLLLDFGGVCLLNPIELHPRFEATFGLDPGTLDWFGPVDPSTDELWRRMIAGDGLNERDYWQQRAGDAGRAAGKDLSLREYMSLIYDPPSDDLIRPGAIAVTKAALAAGIGVSILTNDLQAFHGEEWQRGIPYLAMVDHLVDCSATGILKPDARAFERAVGIVGAEPARVLFVDDQPLNVGGAEAVGIPAMWFDIANPAESWRQVAERLRLGQ